MRPHDTRNEKRLVYREKLFCVDYENEDLLVLMIHFDDNSALLSMASMIGKPVKVDVTIVCIDRSKYALHMWRLTS